MDTDTMSTHFQVISTEVLVPVCVCWAGTSTDEIDTSQMSVELTKAPVPVHFYIKGNCN